MCYGGHPSGRRTADPDGRRTGDTPAGGGQAETPVGAIHMLQLGMRAHAMGEGNDAEGAPSGRQGRCMYQNPPGTPFPKVR
jgi:hypothetical protein